MGKIARSKAEGKQQEGTVVGFYGESLAMEAYDSWAADRASAV